ncbi:MAG TPA: pyrroline-5-carboxylate reductase [Anaerolineae bacterium]|nr:pyrroline-5-carboxylate reductase [Anaerolineae bacterium]
MLKDMRFAFIGSGAMAEAMIKGLTSKADVPGDRITASGPRPERGDELQTRYGVRTTTDNMAAIDGADIVVLSVKPQVLLGVLEQLAGRIAPDALVLSIVAGARIEPIVQTLQHEAVARSMPNTPAQIGLGMTVWTCGPQLSEAHRAHAQAVFQSCGEEVFVGDERYLDMATALSGTGPAYVFLFMEAMVDAGVHLGFSRRVAEQMVYQTVRGSVEYARQAGRHLATLRNQVTSPGGTSAEALYQIEKGGLRTVMSRAIWAAYQKSRRLGKGVEE